MTTPTVFLVSLPTTTVSADGALTTAHYQLCSRPANTDAHMSNLLLLMAQRMGVEIDQFGDSNKVIAL